MATLTGTNVTFLGFEVAPFQIVLDVATALSIVASAIYVTYRYARLAKRLEVERVQRMEDMRRKAVVEERESLKLNELFEINLKLREAIVILHKTLTEVAKNGRADEEAVKRTIHDTWRLLDDIWSRLVLYGTPKQLTAVTAAREHFRSSLTPLPNNTTHIAPRVLVTSLITLQRELLLDGRKLMTDEPDAKVEHWVQGYLTEQYGERASE